MSLIFREGDSERLLQEMHNTEQDIHAMVVYPETSVLIRLYTRYIAEALQQNTLVVYASHYETVNAVKSNFIRTGALNSEAFQEYEKNGSLLVLDNIKTHFGHEFDILSITKLLSRLAENQRKRGAVIMADMGWYYLEDNIDGLIENELQMPRRIGHRINCKTFCLYHKRDFGRLPEHQQDVLRDRHLKSLEMSQ